MIWQEQEMGKIKTGLLLICVFALFAFVACSKKADAILSNDGQTEADDTDASITADVTDNMAEALAGNSIYHEDADDYLWDEADVIAITLNGNSATVDGSGASVSGSQVTITSAGTYSLQGSLTDGQIIVNTEEKGVVRLILNGINIHNATSAPLYVLKSKKTVIILAENTNNVVTDGSAYVFASADEDEPNAAIFSKSDLSFCGSGSLTVKGNYNDGIASKDGLVIASGTINVTSVDDGIRGKDCLVLKDGNITVNADGDGLKSDNEEDATRGYILVEKGKIKITSDGDAITAQTDVLIRGGSFTISSGGGSDSGLHNIKSCKGIKAPVEIIIDYGTFVINSSDDALHSDAGVAINGGTLTLSSHDDGIHADSEITINGGNVTIAKSYESMESGLITINDGNINMTSSDDGFNATQGIRTEGNDGSFLYLNGGTIHVNSSTGDGLDSNGSIVMTGGTVIVHGPKSQPEVGMDYNGTCKISDGTLVISGTSSNMTQAPSSSSTQYSVLVRFSTSQSANSIVHIQDSNGTDILTFAPVRAYQSIVLSSPDLVKGNTYTVYTGGRSTGTVSDGFYTGGTYSGGTKYTDFTITNVVTTVGAAFTGTGPGPGFGPGG